MKGMKRTLSGNLLFAARSLLVLAFVAHLTVVVVGYYILPYTLVTCVIEQDGELKSIGSKSKEHLLCSRAVLLVFILLIGFFGMYIVSRDKPKADQPIDFWDRGNNYILKRNIAGIGLALMGGAIISYHTWIKFQYLHINLSSPPSGELTKLPWAEISAILCLAFGVLYHLTLFLIKRYHERSGHLPDVDSSESQT